MAVPFSNTKLRVPRGFQNLLEGLAREVLRAQPEDVHAFAAQYFEDLLKIRDGGGDDPSKVGADLEDRFYNNKSFQDPDVDPSNPDHQKAALSIQTKYRQYHAKKEVEKMKEEHAAVTIQAGIRGYHARKEVEEIKKDEPQNETGAPEEDIDIDLNDPEVNAAATKIQASFKGHKARKEVQAIKEAEAAKTEEAKKPEEEEIDIDLNDPEVANAATKIQANFRGYKTRKGMKDGEGKDGEAAAEPAKEEEKKEEEEIDIDLDDPETAKAALKIQSTFRGHMARKEVKKEDA